MIGATAIRSHMQRLGRLAVQSGRLNSPKIRFLSSQSQPPEQKVVNQSGHVDQSSDEVEIYKKSQGFTVRVMCGISMVNLMVSTSFVITKLLTHMEYLSSSTVLVKHYLEPLLL